MLVFGKAMENVRNHIDLKVITNAARKDYLTSEPNYHSTNYFVENLLATEMKNKTNILEH